MAEEQKKEDRPFVERWLEEQKEWQKTMLTYVDTMANNEDFLVHLGNAMRGSLLAGKPYPGTAPAASGAEAEPAGGSKEPADERLDRILFTLHELQGQLNDLQLTVDRLVASTRSGESVSQTSPPLQFGNAASVEPSSAEASPAASSSPQSSVPASDRERDDV